MKIMTHPKSAFWSAFVALLGFIVVSNGNGAESLPPWIGADFSSIGFSRTNCQIVFKEQGIRFSCTIQRPGQIEESLLSNYGSSLHLPYGTQAKLHSRGVVIEVGSLGVLKAKEVAADGKELCNYSGADRKKLCLDVPAFAVIKRVDRRSLGKQLIEYRAIIVPISETARTEVERLEKLMAEKYKTGVHKNRGLIWVTCEQTID